MSDPDDISPGAAKRVRSLEANNRYRARRMGADAVRVDFLGICRGEGWTCCICGEGIDPELDPAEARSLSLEHVIALAAGGKHNAANIRPAHRACNVAKGHADAQVAAKIKRQARQTGPQADHRKAKKRAIQSRGFQTNRSGPFKRTLDGRVIRRGKT